MNQIKESIIAYTFISFPKITETFTLREMIGLEKRGIHVELFSLLEPKKGLIHPEAEILLGQTHYSKWFLSRKVLASNLYYFVKNPWLYIKLIFKILMASFRQPLLFSKALFMFPKSVYFARIARKKRVQHIHASFASYNAICAMVMAELGGINYSVTAAAYDLFLKRDFLIQNLKKAKFIRTISQYNIELIRKRFEESIISKTHLIRRGIDLERYKSGSMEKNNNKIFRILCVASLEAKKGHTFLLDAIQFLKTQDLSIECVFVGEGVLRDSIQEQISSLDIEDRVKMIGAQTQDEVIQWLQKSDCFILPSIVGPGGRMEGIPNAVLEAMACLVPVITTQISGIPELVKDGKTGLLVPPEDVGALINAILWVHDYPDKARELALSACHIIENEYNLENNVDKLFNLFSHNISFNEKYVSN